MILRYVKLDLTHVPRLQDLCRMAFVGRILTMHFVRALQRAECDAYVRIRERMTLAGNVQVDGTYLGRFWIKGSNRQFASQIEKVKNNVRKKNDRNVKMPKSLQVHVMALGGVVRGEHETYVALPTPVVSCPGTRPPTELASGPRM